MAQFTKTNANRKNVIIQTSIAVTGHEVEYPSYQILDCESGSIVESFTATCRSEQRPPCQETCCPVEREFGYTIEHYSYPKLEDVIRFCEKQNFTILKNTPPLPSSLDIEEIADQPNTPSKICGGQIAR